MVELNSTNLAGFPDWHLEVSDRAVAEGSVHLEVQPGKSQQYRPLGIDVDREELLRALGMTYGERLLGVAEEDERVTEEDERITAWERVASHPFFLPSAYDSEGTLIDAMLAMLDGVTNTRERVRFAEAALDTTRERAQELSVELAHQRSIVTGLLNLIAKKGS